MLRGAVLRGHVSWWGNGVSTFRAPRHGHKKKVVTSYTGFRVILSQLVP